MRLIDTDLLKFPNIAIFDMKLHGATVPMVRLLDLKELMPTVPAVPLDKLCECLVRKRIGFVDEVDGKRLTATLDKALWATLIEEWMEGLDADD